MSSICHNCQTASKIATCKYRVRSRKRIRQINPLLSYDDSTKYAKIHHCLPTTSPAMKARAMIDARTSFILARLAVLSTTLTWHSHRIEPMDDCCFGRTTRYEGPPLLYGSSILCVCSCYAYIAHMWAKLVQIELNYLRISY